MNPARKYVLHEYFAIFSVKLVTTGIVCFAPNPF